MILVATIDEKTTNVPDEDVPLVEDPVAPSLLTPNYGLTLYQDGDSPDLIAGYNASMNKLDSELAKNELALSKTWSLTSGREISSNGDLNNLWEEGNYWIAGTSRTKNRPPIAHVDAIVKVTSTQKSSVYGTVYSVLQEFISAEDGTKWSRSLDNAGDSPEGTWTPWQCTGGIASIVASGESGMWVWVKYSDKTYILRGYKQSSLTTNTGPIALASDNYPFSVKTFLPFCSGGAGSDPYSHINYCAGTPTRVDLQVYKNSSVNTMVFAQYLVIGVYE